MTGRQITWLSMAAIVTAVAIMPGAAAAQEPRSERVQKLYASAEYEELLRLVDESTEPSEQFYQALCLLALGRTEEAEATLQALVMMAPDFTVPASDVPPRMATLLTRTRQEQLPIVLRRIFTEAREQYQSRTFDAARSRFQKIIAISSQQDVRDVEEVIDLRVLAEGFLDLTSAPRDSVPEAVTPAPAAAPAPPRRPESTPPVMVKQDLPPWPVGLGAMATGTTGALRLQISSTGRVTEVTVVKGIHPLYDLRLITAARFWEYRPATLNGLPVDSESTVEVRVVPPRADP